MVNRIEPQLPVEAMQTYSVVVPRSTHFRPATCFEVDCPNFEHGWKTVVNQSTELGAAQAHYIRNESGRRFTEHREGAAAVFVFEAGQRCFAAHQVPLERDPIFLVVGGDWRGNPTGFRRAHKRPEDWVEDFAEHQQRIADRLERG
jgi:hypothetical protein